MYNPIPVFEAKNKLPYFLHLAETDGPIPIMRHNNVVAYIISKNDYEQIRNENKPQKSLVQKLQDNRKKYGLEQDDFDYPAYFESLRASANVEAK
jgi:prevent-host-death family protein